MLWVQSHLYGHVQSADVTDAQREAVTQKFVDFETSLLSSLLPHVGTQYLLHPQRQSDALSGLVSRWGSALFAVRREALRRTHRQNEVELEGIARLLWKTLRLFPTADAIRKRLETDLRRALDSWGTCGAVLPNTP